MCNQPEGYEVEASAVGERLDVFLARMARVSRSQAAAAIRQGLVLIDDIAVTKPGRALRSDEVVTWTPPELQSYDLIPEAIPLSILYEDAHLIVLDKPAGLVVHPAPGHPHGTLVNALLAHGCEWGGIGGVLRPGIVHRIDKDTSGLLVVAKHDAAHQALAEQFAVHSIEREYRAFVFGRLAASPLVRETFLARHPEDRKRFAVAPEGVGKRAVTVLKTLFDFGAVSLLSATLYTGRTHQIRVHVSSLGHPVVGDAVYGGVARVNDLRDKPLAARLRPIRRQLLHAGVLGFVHPITGERLRFEAPLPPDMAELLAWLQARAGVSA